MAQGLIVRTAYNMFKKINKITHKLKFTKRTMLLQSFTLVSQYSISYHFKK